MKEACLPNSLNACKICDGIAAVRKVRTNGVLICEACRKFFARNSANTTLQCIASDSQCNVNRRKAGFHQASRKRPLSCPKCRLARCFEVGMVLPLSSSKAADFRDPSTSKCSSSSSSSSSSPSPASFFSQSSSSSGGFFQPSPFATSQRKPSFSTLAISSPTSNFPSSETAINVGQLRGPEIAANGSKIVTCLMTNVGVLQRLPYVQLNFDVNSTSVSEILPEFTKFFNELATICAPFVKELPGLQMLLLEDRRILGKSSIFSFYLAQSCQPYSAVHPMIGSSETSRALLGHFFPNFQDLEKQAFEIASAMATWKPSSAEFALLQALIYYKRPHQTTLIQMTRPDIVVEMHDSLLSVMRQFVANVDAKDQECRWYRFNCTYNLLNMANQRFQDWATRFPDNVSNDDPFFCFTM